MVGLRLAHDFPDVRLNLTEDPLLPCELLLLENVAYHHAQSQFTYTVFWNFKIVGKCDFLNVGLSLTQDPNVRLTVPHLHIQATGRQHWCESVALLLHYLHLVASCWLFSVGILAYRRLTEGPCPSGLCLHCALAWLLPAIHVLVSN
jgi:hypothetical protein